MWNRAVQTTVGLATVAALVITGGTAAQAAAPSPDADEIALAINDVSPSAEIAAAPDVLASGLEVNTESGSVALPHTPEGDIVIDSAVGVSEFRVQLPDVASSRADIARDGTVVYPGDGPVDVAVQADGSSARIHTVLKDASAPREYAYTIPGSVPELQADGSVVLTAESDGISVDFGVIAEPWAYDAAGQAVPTAYRVEGDTVIQTLDLSGDVAFPVVADPWIQADCGIITCTVRFSRATTRNIRDGAALGAIGAGVVAAFSGGLAVPAAALVAAALGVHNIVAGRFYENGNCLGLRFLVQHAAVPAYWYPVQVKRNTYNCS